MIKEYIRYIKNNPEKYWFKAKLYGWGWTPARWQGFVVLFGFIGLAWFNFYRIDSVSHSVSDTLINFVPETVVLIFALLAVCWKTGEKPGWRWGISREKKRG